jgi:hypothetical protein
LVLASVELSTSSLSGASVFFYLLFFFVNAVSRVIAGRLASASSVYGTVRRDHDGSNLALATIVPVASLRFSLFGHDSESKEHRLLDNVIGAACFYATVRLSTSFTSECSELRMDSPA